MRDIELFQLALGLVPPWMVADAKFDADKKRLDIEIDFKTGGRFACPECGKADCSVHDTVKKTWRHLNFFQHQLPACARPPRRLPQLRRAPRHPAALEPAKGRKVSLEQCFARYTSDSGKRELMAPDGFMDAMSEFCRGVGIRTKIEGDKLYLIDVELADTSPAGRLGPMARRPMP